MYILYTLILCFVSYGYLNVNKKRVLVVDIWLKPEDLLCISCEHGQVRSLKKKIQKRDLLHKGPRDSDIKTVLLDKASLP